MTISIITPSYGQLDWLRLCVASVADQVAPEAHGSWKLEAGSLEGDTNEGRGAEAGEQRAEVGGSDAAFEVPTPNSQFPASAQSSLTIEHIIQDGGTPGIEEFAREVGAEFYRDGEMVFGSRPTTLDSRPYRIAIYSEADAGMYDAINKGITKISGEIWAWLNSDEQYLPGTLAYVDGWFEKHPATEILCGDALLTDDQGIALSYRRIVRPFWVHTRLDHLASASCSTFYRCSVVEKAGLFDTAWRSIGDAEWMARAMKSKVRIHACGRLFSTFAFTGQNTSESPLAAQEAERWRASNDAPPSSLRNACIVIHRMRKMMAGAYRKRSVSYAIHSHGGGVRKLRHAEGLLWGWPSAKKAESSGDGSQRTEVLISDTTSVLGTSLLATDYEGLASMVNDLAFKASPAVVDFANTQIVTMRRHDPEFAKLTECIDITVPDGMPLVWAMNAMGASLKDRVYGPTFTRKLLASCPVGKTHYLVGGSEECGKRFRERMLALNPSLDFVGSYHGRCSADGVLEDDEAVLNDLRSKRPDFIWVGLGTPKQYGWIARNKPLLERGVMLAVGFAFDVNAGMKPDAPMWMQRVGLTWLYRMASEPKRLFGRYLTWNTLFMAYSVIEMWGRSTKTRHSRSTSS